MIPFESWLKSFGFLQNPFETTEAGSEADHATDFLHATFVKPEGFDRILGNPLRPKSSLVFAARGHGKSTVRLMLAHFCRQGIFFTENSGENYNQTMRALPVFYTQFPLHLDAVTSASDLVDTHVTEILNRAIPGFVDLLTSLPDMADRARKMDPLRRIELQSFLVFFRKNLSLKKYKDARDVLGKEIVQGDHQTPIGFIQTSESRSGIELTEVEMGLLLSAREKVLPSDMLKRFAELITDIGLHAVYILIDGLDETHDTADDPDAAGAIIVPLLSNLNLMNSTPHVAFKVFAPAEMESSILEATRKVRKDRLDILSIQLEEAGLLEILHRRLAQCSNGAISSLDAVCVPAMRNQMDLELVRRARGNARHLILLGDYAIRARCQAGDAESGTESYLLTERDLDSAELRMNSELLSESSVVIVSEEGNVVNENIPVQGIATPRPDDWPRHELPTPLAMAYLAYSREPSAQVKAWKLFDLIEAATGYLAIAVISLLYQAEGAKTGERLVRADIDMQRVYMGRWRYCCETLPGLCASLGIKHPLIKGTQQLMKSHKDFLRKINDERNRFAHDGPQPEEVCKDLIANYHTPLHEFLADLQQKHRSCRLIKVREIVKRGFEFVHKFTLYQGDSIYFPQLEINLPVTLDGGQLWLLGGSFPLDVHPLMLAQVATGNLAEEIWLYQGVENEIVSYKSYGAGRTLDTKEFRKDVKLTLGV